MDDYSPWVADKWSFVGLGGLIFLDRCGRVRVLYIMCVINSVAFNGKTTAGIV